ncbi:MAG: hypothetical protein LBQ47_07135 [Endomicrobium sp.]|jgi:hypothetical protein|nr:hypothetical protein [Endomicrobium sp.]
MTDNKQDILNKLRILEEEKEKLINQLQSFEVNSLQKHASNFTVQEKINIFRSLFKGRQDVYARRFENSATHKSGYYPVKNKEEFLPVTDEVIKSHLQGYSRKEFSYQKYKKDFTVGIYPLLQDDATNFLAIDFDGEKYKNEVKHFADICKSLRLPAYIEISRSGCGAHIWFFFDSPIAAYTARKLGTFLLSKTMEECPQIKFSTFDRMFPAQDILPKGGLGNLIALPLQNKPRKQGNSIFVDENFAAFEDQWKFLSEIKKISLNEIENIISKTGHSFNALFEDMSYNTRNTKKEISFDNIKLPAKINAVLKNAIYIDIENIPPKLLNEIMKLAVFRNPEFYKMQAMRLPVYNKPRVISCADVTDKYAAIPRGCLNELNSLLTK